jgi:hypothetical protein
MPKTDAQESFHAGDDRLTTRSGHSFEHSRVLFDEFGSDSADQGASASSQAGETDTSVVGMGRTLDQPPWVAASSCSAAPVRPGWSRASNPACVEVGLCLRSTSTASFFGRRGRSASAATQWTKTQAPSCATTRHAHELTRPTNSRHREHVAICVNAHLLRLWAMSQCSSTMIIRRAVR